MPFNRQTLTEIVTQIENDITSSITGATTLLRRSILKVLARAYGGAVHLLYGNIEFNKDQLFVTTADGEHLETHANEYGISRTAAVKATGSGTATGTAGTAIPIYTQLQSASGQVYLTDAAVSVGAGGSVSLDFTAQVAGADGNDDSGITLSFVSPISGVNTSVTVSSGGIDGGSDEETDDALRTRVLTRKRQPPHGGADFDYEGWMLEVSGVTRAWAVSLYQGIGTIGCAFVRDNDDDLIPSASEITTVENYIISHTDPLTGIDVGIPVTAEAGLYMINLTKKTMNFTIAIYPNTAAVRSAIEAKLQELILEEGGPEQTIYLSQIITAVSTAVGEDRNTVSFPTEDITASAQEIHVMGTATFSTYNG